MSLVTVTWEGNIEDMTWEFLCPNCLHPISLEFLKPDNWLTISDYYSNGLQTITLPNHDSCENVQITRYVLIKKQTNYVKYVISQNPIDDI